MLPIVPILTASITRQLAPSLTLFPMQFRLTCPNFESRETDRFRQTCRLRPTRVLMRETSDGACPDWLPSAFDVVPLSANCHLGIKTVQQERESHPDWKGIVFSYCPSFLLILFASRIKHNILLESTQIFSCAELNQIQLVLFAAAW